MDPRAQASEHLADVADKMRRARPADAARYTLTLPLPSGGTTLTARAACGCRSVVSCLARPPSPLRPRRTP
ncbi:unnamed protein product, partial [Iphiclides podalirius]